MKRTKFFRLLVILSVFALFGCVTVSTTYQDQSLSWREQSLLLPSGNPMGIVKIYGFDDNMSSKIVDAKIVGANIVAVISSGIHTIHVHVTTTSFGREYSTQEPIPITYEFQPGKRYVLYGTIDTSLLGIGDGATKVGIMTVEEYKSEYAKFYPNYTDQEINSRYQSWVLDRFDKAEAELNK
jgi:hypothetical protein